MNTNFQQRMAEATRLTRAGDLQAATASIQAALRSGAAPFGSDADVIDIDVREVDEDGLGVQEVEAQDLEPHDIGVRSVDAAEAPVRERSPDTRQRPTPPSGQFIPGRHTEAAGTRDYKLYIPPAGHAQALPLVVMLHGCTQNPDDFAAGTGMNDAALERGFFVLYPAQAQQANPSRCWNWFKHNHQQRGRGEPALLAGMVREVMARHPIDPQRVYVAGLSAGGAMAAILGDAYPELFAAVGVHSGLPVGAASDLPSALAAMKTGASSPAVRAAARADASSAQTPPTIVFHGDQDGTVHPVNGEHVVAARAAGANLESTPGRSDNGRAYTRRNYRGAHGRIVAEHWVVHGAGHAWSGGSARGSFTDPKGPDATREMLRFFFTHTLRTVR
jgi:poly(hydroxyalkanoate) depolymerase family esterase